MNVKNSSKHVQGLKQLNFQGSTGLLSLLDTEKNDENKQRNSEVKEPKIQRSTENNEEEKQGNSEVEEKANQNGVCNCDTSSVQNSTPNIGLYNEVSKAFRNNRSIANKCKVFVGNIGFKVKSREFKDFFGYFGKVLQAQIVQDRIKKRSRGFGFVTFSNEYEAEKAKQSTDEERTLNDRVMTVMTPTRKRKGGPVCKEQSLEDALEEFQHLSLLEDDDETIQNVKTNTEK